MAFTRVSGAFTHTVDVPPVPQDAAVILQGRCRGRPARLGLNKSLLARGILLLGAARSGKSVTQTKLIRQLQGHMGPQDCMVILDTKGEYASRFYKPGDWILGRGGANSPNVGWNLLWDCTAGCGTEEDLRQRAAMISACIFAGKENQQTPYFTDAPRRVLEVLLETLIRHPEILPQGECLDNHGLLAFLRRGDWDAFLKNCSAPKEMISYLGSDSTRRSPAERSVLAELQINVSNRLCGNFAGHGAFSMIQFEERRGGQTLFLQYDPRDGGACDPVYGLLLDLLFTSFLTGKHPEGKLYVFLDEFHVLGQAPELFLKTLNYGPGIGLGTVCVAAQSLAQLQQLCGEAGAETMLAGLQNRFLFHVEDTSSRDFVREQCGSVPVQVVSYVPGIAYHISAGALQSAVEDSELIELKTGEAVVKMPSYPAFFFQFDP